MIYDLRFTIWARLVVLFAIFHLPSSIFHAHAQPTNPPVLKLVSVTVGTNSALVGYGTNLFRTNLTLVRAAGIVAPTNSRVNGYVPVATGDQTKWQAMSDAQPPSANLTNWSTLDTNVLSGLGSGILTSDGYGTNTSLYYPFLYFNNAVFGNSNNIANPATFSSFTGNAILSGATNEIVDYDSSGGTHETDYNVISGGNRNSTSGRNNKYNATAGGLLNRIGSSGTAQFNVIGGYSNGIAAIIGSGDMRSSVVFGEHNNVLIGAGMGGSGGVMASGSAAIGVSNYVHGGRAIGLGTSVEILHNGVFYWSDSLGAVGYPSTASNQFLIRATGGVGINTNNPGTNALKVVGNVDSTVGFSINGVPLMSGGIGGGGIFTNIEVWATGGNSAIYLVSDSIYFATFHPTNILFDAPVTVANDLRFPKLTWGGATNTLSLANKYYHYATSTDASITGLTQVQPDYAQWVVLRITNSAATDKTLYLPTTWTTDDGARSYVLTNARVSILSVGTYGTSMTNAVFRTMY